MVKGEIVVMANILRFDGSVCNRNEATEIK